MKRVFIIVLLFTFFLTGCSVSSTLEKGLTMDNFAFCEQINGDRDYVERVNKTFSPKEVVYVYFEVYGFKSKKLDSSITYHPIVDVIVKDSEGNIVIDKTTVVDQELSSKSEINYIYFPISLTFPENSKNGKYNLTIYVKDAFGSGSITRNEQFFLSRDT